MGGRTAPAVAGLPGRPGPVRAGYRGCPAAVSGGCWRQWLVPWFRSCALARAQVEKLAQRLKVDGPRRAGAELLGPDGRPVQGLTEDAVNGSGRLGLLPLSQVREPVVQPGQFGVGELGDLCVHRRYHRRGAASFCRLVYAATSAA